MKTKILTSIILIICLTSCKTKPSFKEKDMPTAETVKPAIKLTKEQEAIKKNLISLLSKDKVFEKYVKINDEMAQLLFNRNKAMIPDDDIHIEIKDEFLKKHPQAQKMVNDYAKMGFKEPEKYARLNIEKFQCIMAITKKYPQIKELDREVGRAIFKEVMDAMPRNLPN